MPRPLSPDLQIEVSRSKTAVGYLIEMELSTTLRFCTYDTVNWAGYIWAKRGIKVGKINRGAGAQASTSLVIGNHEDALGAFVLGEVVSGKPVRIWSYYGNTANSGLQEFSGVIGDVVFNDPPADSLTFNLVTPEISHLRSPRQQINAASGFKTLLPKGTKLTFSNGTTYTLER